MERIRSGYFGDYSVTRMNALLNEMIVGDFEETSFLGVKKKELDRNLVPQEIQAEIGRQGGRVLRFFMLKAEESIPNHEHCANGEIYFGGQGGDVEIHHRGAYSSFEMEPSLFIFTYIGESHSVSLKYKSVPVIFFGSIFEVDYEDERQDSYGSFSCCG